MKRFTKEAKIGLAGVVSILILYYGIAFLKGFDLFSSQSRYFVEFANISQLTKSSPVYADGYSIGIVRDIAYNFEKPGHVVVAIDVDSDLRIPAGSTAHLETEMLGTVKMNLLLANNPRQRMEPGDTLTGEVNAGLMTQAADMLPAIEKMIPKLDSILTAVNALVNDPALANTLHNTEQMTGNLNRTSAKLDKMMNTLPELTNNLNQVCQNAQNLTAHLDEKVQQLDVAGTMQRINTTLANVEEMTEKINNGQGTIGLLLNDTELYTNLNRTMGNAADLLSDFKSHPKRYVHFSLFGKKDK
ncbi:MAG: MCE family protein [Bacteroidaceae bacterium]|nr:MCE family protein [Bacteroidaceae bacterium]MCF0185788.1 MCE family protein [Bacteroidaceae bacterium]